MPNRYRMVVRGLRTYLPGWTPPRPGGTDSGRYCYSVWLRHLASLRRAGLTRYPKVIAELGPGESLGLGLAGLLGGGERYIGLDVVHYAGTDANLRVFDELVDLYTERSDLPGDDEFPRVHPRLESYRFADVVSESDTPARNLAEERLTRLREDLRGLSRAHDSGSISYVCPWFDAGVIEEGSVDVAFSQAVLEHVEDLPGTYAALARWMKPGGMMSHQIDFKCHGMTSEWNGHWGYSAFVWRAIHGRHPYLLNREVLSTHLALMKEAGFRVLSVNRVRGEGGLPRRRLARSHRDISDDDLATSGAHVIAVKS